MTDRNEPGKDPQADLVKLKVAKSPFEAKVVAGVLLDAGIPAFIEGQSLTDEFAMSQRLMNLQGVTIMVPRDRVDDAHEALAAAKEAGRRLGEGDENDDESGSDG